MRLFYALLGLFFSVLALADLFINEDDARSLSLLIVSLLWLILARTEGRG